MNWSLKSEIKCCNNQANSSVRSSLHITRRKWTAKYGASEGKLTSLRKNPLTALANKKRRRRRRGRGRRVTRSIFQKAAASERVSGGGRQKHLLHSLARSLALGPLSRYTVISKSICWQPTRGPRPFSPVHAWRMDPPSAISRGHTTLSEGMRAGKSLKMKEFQKRF